MRWGELIGRESERRKVDSLLAGGARLLTLLGPPGAGKTALARAILEERGGVFCDLTACASLHEVCAVVLGALGLKLDGDDPASAVLAALRARRATTIVLDNFEQLPVECGPTLSRWHDRTAHVLLVTSRVRLHLSEARVVPLEPLEEEPGLELFVRTAERAGVAETDAEQAREIVRRVGGMPLAIELAAGRARGLGLAGLLAALEGGVDALGTAPIDAPPHHRSMRQAVEASFALLTEEELDLLAASSLLEGRFALEEVTRVVSTVGDGVTDGIADRMERLVDSSLVASDAVDGRACYRVHPLLRELALERLDGARRLELEEGLARWLVELAGELAVDPSTAVLRRVDGRATDLRRAWTRLLEQGDGPGAATLACALGRLVDLRGPTPDLVTVLERSWEAIEPDVEGGARHALACRLVATLAYARFERGDLEAAGELYRQALGLARGGVGPRTEAVALAQLATLALRGERLDEARELLDEAEASRGGEDEWARGLLLGARGLLAFRQDDRAAAEQAFARCRAHYQRAGDELLEGLALGLLGNLAQDRGALVEAQTSYEEAVARLGALGAGTARAIFSGYLATALDERGDEGAAREMYEEAVVLLREQLNPRFEALFLAAQGSALARAGRVTEARAALDQAEHLIGADAMSSPASRATLALHRAQLEVALARASQPATEESQAHLARACRRLEGCDPAVHASSDDVRFAHRMLGRALAAAFRELGAEPAHDAWAIGWRGEVVWHTGHRIDLATRVPLRRILWTLVLERLERPSAALSADALIDAGWPGERALPDAAAHRLRVALSSLRKLGLGGVLETVEDGWRLSPEARFTLRAAN